MDKINLWDYTKLLLFCPQIDFYEKSDTSNFVFYGFISYRMRCL